MGKSEKHLCLGDHHFPFHDPRAIKATERFIAREGPFHTVHIMGDLLDLDQLSRFIPHTQRWARLQDDFNQAAKYLEDLRTGVTRRTAMEFHEGNHDYRLEKHLRSKAPRLESLDSLTLDSQYGLSKQGIRFHSWRKPFWHLSLYFTHGSLARKWSCYTARGMVEKVGGSVGHGHSHRLGTFHQTTWSGNHYKGFENGCLCSMEPEYIEGTPDWQQGFSLVTFRYSKSLDRWIFCVEQAEILPSGEYLFRGELH